MAYSAVQMVTDFRREYGRFNTSGKKVLKVEEIIAILNKALFIYVKEWTKRIEVDSKARKVLRKLEEKEKSLDLNNNNLNYVIGRFPNNFYHLLRQRAIVEKTECGTKEIPITIFQTDDLNLARKDPFWKSTFEWEHAIGDEGSEGLYVWHDNEFKINNIIIDYYRKPKEIHAPSMKLPDRNYIYSDGNRISRNQDLELDSEFSAIDIVNIGVLNSLSITDDPNDYSLKLKEIIETHQLALL